MYGARLLQEGNRVARKHHQCYHCGKYVAPGETYSYQNCVADGTAYRIKWHTDCQELFDRWVTDANLHSYDFDDGYPPLYEAWSDEGGDAMALNCDFYRGRYPAVVARIEAVGGRYSPDGYDQWKDME